jgi:hypothetical protein
MTTKEILKRLREMYGNNTIARYEYDRNVIANAIEIIERFENSLDLGEELTTNLGVYELYAIPKEQE